MNGPHTALTIEAVLSERAREARLARSRARLRWDTPREATFGTRAVGWLRLAASRLGRLTAQPQCCPCAA